MSNDKYKAEEQNKQPFEDFNFNISNSLYFDSVEEEGFNWLNEPQPNNLHNEFRSIQHQKNQTNYHQSNHNDQIQLQQHKIPQDNNHNHRFTAQNQNFDSQFCSEQKEIKEYLEQTSQQYENSVMEEESPNNQNEFPNLPLNLSVIDKSSLAKKIHQLYMKKMVQNENSDAISVSTNDQNILHNEQFNNDQLRNERTGTIIQIIEELKTLFEEYTKRQSKSYSERLSWRTISEKVDISIAEVKFLYEEYLKDPEFTQRIKKLNDTTYKQTGLQPLTNNQNLLTKRIKFIEVLVNKRGAMSTQEIVDEMSQVESLHNFDNFGNKIAISKKIIQHIMNVGNIKPRRVPMIPRNNNTYDSITNRFKYALKYLHLTDDKASDICFLGQFSFVNSLSLSSCPLAKRDSFVDMRYIRGEPKPRPDAKLKTDIKAELGTGNPDDRYGRNLQYLIVLSLHGVIYYELYYHIFQEMNFPKTLDNIGKTMKTRTPNQKKYLILETSFFHIKKDLQKFQNKYNVKVIFLPPNTPMLNPTEYLFNEVKQLVKSKSYKIKRPYASVLTQTLETLKEKNMQSYYTCIRPYLELALRQEPFK